MAPSAINTDTVPDTNHSFMESSYGVIIAGAGVVGLFTACELAMQGVSVLVLEQNTKEQTPAWKNNRLAQRNLFVPSIEAMYRRGLLEQIFPNHAQRPTHVPQKTKGFQMAGHFAGMMINGNNVDYSQWEGVHLPGPACVPDVAILGHVENVLAERAEALGVRIIRGMGVSRFVDEDKSVQVWAGDECFKALWLVGCDGGRSTVRKLAGIALDGTEAEFTGYAAECVLDQPGLLKPGFSRTSNGLYIAHGPLVWVLEHGTSFDRSQPVTREHFQDVLQRVSGTNVAVTRLDYALSFSDRCKQATEYLKGRVVLAGDSAHIHPPFGAQGLNTGICDAMNLGWKLAATVKGWASPDLLQSYHNERHPEAAAVLNWVRAQIVTLRPGPMSQAVANFVRDLINTEGGATQAVGYVWGLSQRYDIGNEHPLVGRTAPDIDLNDGQRVGTRLQSGSFVFVDLEGNSSLENTVRSMEPVVQYARSNATDKAGCKGLLLRPDGVVAFVLQDEADASTAIEAAISRWINVRDALSLTRSADFSFRASGQQSWKNRDTSLQSPVPAPVNIQSIIGRSLDEQEALQFSGHDKDLTGPRTAQPADRV